MSLRTVGTTENEILLVNFDRSFECLLREIRCITSEPLNLKLPTKFRELIPIVNNDRTIRYCLMQEKKKELFSSSS